MKALQKHFMKDQRGQAMVELAIVVSLVCLFLLLPIIDFGHIYSDSLTINNATRTAARAYVVGVNTHDDVKAIVTSLCQNNGLSADSTYLVEGDPDHKDALGNSAPLPFIKNTTETIVINTVPVTIKNVTITVTYWSKFMYPTTGRLLGVKPPNSNVYCYQIVSSTTMRVE